MLAERGDALAERGDALAERGLSEALAERRLERQVHEKSARPNSLTQVSHA